MSLVHPVVPRNATPPTPLPTAIDNINAALRALDGADTLVIDAAATALDTVLPRLPQVLAVHGVPSSLDGSGRYVLRLPSNGAADQVLIVANRTASPLRLTTADGANALVASLAAGRIEAFVLSGSTVGAYALSSTRTGKAAASHTHPASEIIGLPATVRTASRHATSSTDLVFNDWRAIAFAGTIGTDELTLTFNDSSRTLVVPSNVSRMRLTASFRLSATSSTFSFAFSKNAESVNDFATFDGNKIYDSPSGGTAWPPTIQTAWIPVVAGDLFRVIVRQNNSGTFSVLASPETWLTAEFK